MRNASRTDLTGPAGSRKTPRACRISCSTIRCGSHSRLLTMHPDRRLTKEEGFVEVDREQQYGQMSPYLPCCSVGVTKAHRWSIKLNICCGAYCTAASKVSIPLGWHHIYLRSVFPSSHPRLTKRLLGSIPECSPGICKESQHCAQHQASNEGIGIPYLKSNFSSTVGCNTPNSPIRCTLSPSLR